MKDLITDTLVQFKKGQITLQQAADRLLTGKSQARMRKVQSNRRLRSLCGALRRERDEAKLRVLKRSLRHEFYHGDQATHSSA